MSPDEDLKAACHEVARETMFDRRPVDVDEIQRVGAAMYEVAKEHLGYVQRSGGTGEYVVHAVRYLGRTHAMPPMRDGTYWFDNALEVLVELAYPNSGPSARDALFYRDLVHGLTETLAELAAPAVSAES